jgi:hypothetical protein
VARLALESSRQIEYLSSLNVGESADELALEYDERALLVPQFVDLGWMSPEDARVLDRISEALAEMSGPSRRDLWTFESLRESDQWTNVRDLAFRFISRTGSTDAK